MAKRMPNLPDGRYRVRTAAGDMYYHVSRVGRGGQTVIGPLPFTLDIGDAVEIKGGRAKRVPK